MVHHGCVVVVLSSFIMALLNHLHVRVWRTQLRAPPRRRRPPAPGAALHAAALHGAVLLAQRALGTEQPHHQVAQHAARELEQAPHLAAAPGTVEEGAEREDEDAAHRRRQGLGARHHLVGARLRTKDPGGWMRGILWRAAQRSSLGAVAVRSGLRTARTSAVRTAAAKAAVSVALGNAFVRFLPLSPVVQLDACRRRSSPALAGRGAARAWGSHEGSGRACRGRMSQG